MLRTKRQKRQLYFQQKKQYDINKLNLITDATIVEDAIRFVADHVKTTSKEDREEEVAVTNNVFRG